MLASGENPWQVAGIPCRRHSLPPALLPPAFLPPALLPPAFLPPAFLPPAFLPPALHCTLRLG